LTQYILYIENQNMLEL